MRLLKPIIYFVCTLLFGILGHNTLPYLIDLRFDLSAPTWRVAVFFLTSKNLVNRQRYFLALGFLTVTESLGDIGMLSVNTSGVDTIDALIIDLYCC